MSSIAVLRASFILSITSETDEAAESIAPVADEAEGSSESFECINKFVMSD